MTTDQMQEFILAATYLNFSEAAKALYMSPSTLTRKISAIERELNLQLFIRDNRSVRLTPAGKALAEGLSEVYEDFLVKVTNAKNIQRGYSSALNVGILDGHSIDNCFLSLIRQISLQYPNITLNLFRGSYGELRQALYNDKADVVVTLDLTLCNLDQISTIALSRTHDYLAVLCTDPLAAREKIYAKDLAEETLIGVGEEDSVIVAEKFRKIRHCCGCNIRWVPDMETYALYVQAGLGIGIVNSHNSLAKDPQICLIDMDQVDIGEKFQPDNDLVYAWNTNNLNPALSNFLDLCQKQKYISTPPVPLNLNSAKSEQDFPGTRAG